MNEITELTRFRATITDDPAARARARDRLVGRMLEDQPPPPVPNRRLLTRRRLAMVAAAAVVVTGGVIAVDSLVVRDRPVGATAEAAALLHQAADRAIESSDPVVGPDEYLHIFEVAVYTTIMDDDTAWLETYTDEQFIPGDPANEWVLRRSARVPYRPEDAELAAQYREAYVDDGFTERALGGAFFGDPPLGDFGSPTPEFLADLPRDPRQLLDQIRSHAGDAGPSRDGEALVVVADVLRTGIVPADLRAALFRTAALIPGVELVDGQANLNGQVGVAVGRYEARNGQRQEIIFDPETGMVIGERQVIVDGGLGPLVPAGTAFGWTAVTTDVVPAASVDEIPADPAFPADHVD